MDSNISDSKIEAAIKHLTYGFSQGNCILFLGAGFSTVAKDKSGRQLCAGSELAKELWKIAFPNDEYDNSNLPDVFHAAIKQSKNSVVSYLNSRFNVNPESIPEWILSTIGLPWRCVYTLNVDNLVEAASNRISKPKFVFASARRAAANSSQAEGAIELVHLNGDLGDLPDRVVFSQENYSSRLIGSDPYYERMVAELFSRTFVFIGTTIDEAPLWQHISMRKGKAKSEGYKVHRPKSYLVVPRLGKARQQVLSDHNIQWLPMNAEEFYELIVRKLGPQVSEGFGVVSSRRTIEGKISWVDSALPTKDRDSADSYLMGTEPGWEDILFGRTIPREIEGKLLTSISMVNSDTRTQVHLLTGTAGDGKSTIARRLAISLNAETKKVAWIDQENSSNVGSIIRQLQDREADVAIIDSAENFGKSLAHLLRSIVSETKTKALIVVLRSNRVDELLDREIVAELRVSEIATSRLSDLEISLLVELLERQNRLGVLLGKEKHERIRAFQTSTERQLLVAMIEATSGEKFEQKVIAEYTDLDPVKRYIYCLVSVATHFRFPMSKEHIFLCVENKDEAPVSLDLLRKRGLIKQNSSKEYESRHRVIASKVFEQLEAENTVLQFIHDIAFAAAALLGPSFSSSHKFARVIQKCTHHEVVARYSTNSAATGSSFYSELEPVMASNYHFWLQRGCYELEMGHFELAETFLRQARELNSEDFRVETSLHHLQMKKAASSPNSQGASDAFNNAVDYLANQIRFNPRNNIYAAHILGSQAVAWVKSAALRPDAKNRLLNLVDSLIDIAIEKNPRNEQLNGVSETVRRHMKNLGNGIGE